MKAIFKNRQLLQRGLTLIELLVALAIVAIVILLMLLGQGLQLSRGEDARRKSDFSRLKIAFEDYYNDHNCYPPPSLLQRCGSNDLSPYVSKVPCDPRTRRPYAYYLDSNCSWYAMYTALGDVNDPVIQTLGCSPNCGIEGESYNYVQSNGSLGVSELAEEINSGGAVQPSPTPPPSPTPSPTPYNALACDPSGICNVYQDPQSSGCPITFTDPDVCQQACANPANRCAN